MLLYPLRRVYSITQMTKLGVFRHHVTQSCVWVIKNLNKSFTDIRLRPGLATPFVVVASQYSLHISPYDPLRPNVTSSIKPEVHSVSQRRQRRTEPRPLGDLRTKFREDRSSGSRNVLSDRQTHTHRRTSWSQYSALLPRRSKKWL